MGSNTAAANEFWSIPRQRVKFKLLMNNDPGARVEWLIGVDHALFAKINLDWTNPFFDRLFPLITDLHENPLTSVVIAMLLGLWAFKEKQRALRWMLIIVIAVGASDMLAYRAVKPFVSRPRPAFSGVKYELRTNEHQGNSFPSNHATNMFAAAFVLTEALPMLGPLFYLYAFLVAYSRVYVGVHFPLDVIAGAVMGTLIAVLITNLLHTWADRPQWKNLPTETDV